MKEYLYKNLVVNKDKLTNLSTIELDGKIILSNVTKYNLFEDKILAIKSNGHVYIYFVYLNENNYTITITLERIHSKDDNFELIRLYNDGYEYQINLNCDIICQGRK